MNMDQDYVAADYMSLQQVQKMNAVTEELVLRTNNASRWQHTSGLFGSYQWLRLDAPVGFGQGMTDMLDAMMQRVLPATHQMTFANFRVPGDFRTPQMNAAVFHESNLHLSDRLMATLGLRFEHHQIKNDYLTTALADITMTMTIPGRPAPTVMNIPYESKFESSVKKTSNQLLPKFGLTYRLCEDGSNIYAVVSKGYLAGGYNFQGFSDIFQMEMRSLGANFPRDGKVQHTADDQAQKDQQISYDAETTWNYEAGTHLNLFDHKVKADVAFFYTQIRNQQISRMSADYGFGRVIDNAGKSYSCGVEAALRGQAFDNHLMWGATYSFTHAKFKEYDDYDNARNLISYKDNYVPFIPQHQFSVNGDYRFDVEDDILSSITLGFNVKGQGKTYWEANNDMYQKFYATLGAHMMFKLNKVEVDFWGRNLTNTNYHTFLVNSQMTNQSFAHQGNPLHAGVDLRMHF
jgi:outer membrane receptor protein involved in Fe transport